MTSTTCSYSSLALYGRQAIFATLPGLMMPKCLACFHVYAWLLTGILGTRVELCGAPGQPWQSAALELAAVFAYLLSIRWMGRYMSAGLTACSTSCKF